MLIATPRGVQDTDSIDIVALDEKRESEPLLNASQGTVCTVTMQIAVACLGLEFD